MKRSTTSGGTRQKSYVTPEMKRTFMRLVSGSYPMAEIADEKTRTISMSSPFDRDVVWKLHSIEMRLLAPTCSTQRLTPADIPDYASHVAAHQRCGRRNPVRAANSRDAVSKRLFFRLGAPSMVGRAGQPQGWPALYRYSYPRSVCHPSVGRWVAVHYRYWIEHTMNAIPQGASAPAVESLSVITYQQQPVITTELLAKLYGTDAHNIRKNFFSNADRFIAGKHFIKLEGAALREFKHSITESDSVKIARNVNSLLLWTERGAARHAKMLDTEQAWEVFEKLEDCYFSVKAAPTSPIGDALKASIAEAVKQALAAQMLPAPAQLPAMKMSIDPRRLIDLMTDLRKIYARLDALGMVASDLPPKWWDQHAVHGIGEPVSRG